MVVRLRYEVELFLLALTFFTRIPSPIALTYSPERLNSSSRYFPLIGVIVGGAGALSFILANTVFPISLSVILSTATTILLTGCFHEDGFSDMCDGFGGGWTKEQVLTIMKDSRVGAYGATGLILMLLAKVEVLKAMPESFIPVALLIAHPLSRLIAASILYTEEYVREDENSKCKPLATRATGGEFMVAVILGILPALLLSPTLGTLLITLIAGRFLFIRLLRRKLGGYTGDCLGSAQQLSELSIYLVLVATL